MRTLNTAKNLASSLVITLVTVLLGFLTRKLFVDNVGIEYLGLNGLLQNILGAVTLLEGGFGTSIIYQMYKPLAEKDEPKIISLMQFFRKVYLCIAGGIFLFGLSLYPFIGFFIKDAGSLSYVSVVYFIFLFNSLIQYFTAYKWAIINADQNAYKLTKINLCYQVGLSCAKLAILYYTSNYILYLLIEMVFNLWLNYAVVKKANSLYPFIVTKKKMPLETKIKKKIATNVRAIFLNGVGGYFMHSTSNIVISSFLGVAIVGLYSNYTMITTLLNSVATQMMNSMSESVAHMIATETKEKSYQVFRSVLFVNYLVIGLFSMVMINTFSPFVSWWLGDEYILGNCTLALIVFNFFVNGIRSAALTFKIKSGIFIQDRFTPLLQGIINLLLALFLVRYWGLNGVLAAYGLAILSIGFWQFPRLIYKITFHLPLWRYFRSLGLYCFSWLMIYMLSRVIFSWMVISNHLQQALVNGALTAVIFVCVTAVMFYRRDEFRALLSYTRNLFNHS